MTTTWREDICEFLIGFDEPCTKLRGHAGPHRHETTPAPEGDVAAALERNEIAKMLYEVNHPPADYAPFGMVAGVTKREYHLLADAVLALRDKDNAQRDQEMFVDLRAALAAATTRGERWEETARLESCNRDYWRTRAEAAERTAATLHDEQQVLWRDWIAQRNEMIRVHDAEIRRLTQKKSLDTDA